MKCEPKRGHCLEITSFGRHAPLGNLSQVVAAEMETLDEEEFLFAFCHLFHWHHGSKGKRHLKQHICMYNKQPLGPLRNLGSIVGMKGLIINTWF